MELQNHSNIVTSLHLFLLATIAAGELVAVKIKLGQFETSAAVHL